MKRVCVCVCVCIHAHMQALDIVHYAKISNGIVGLIEYSSSWRKEEVPLS